MPKPKPAAPAPRDNSRNVEQYAPQLLLALTGIRRPPEEDVAKWRGWVEKDLAKRGWRAYRELLGQGSWNHLWMLGACALWLGIPGARDWWVVLLAYQLGEVTREGREMLGCLHGTEPLSHYETMRWGSVLGVRAWAERHGDAELLRLTARYSEVNAALLSLFAVPWPDPVERRGGRGQLTYDGPEVAAVGERNGGHNISSLSPLLALSAYWRCTIRAAAVDWAVEITRHRSFPGFGLPERSASYCRLWMDSRYQPALQGLRDILADIHFAPQRQVHAWVYPDALAVWDPERNNGNTPPVQASFQERGKPVKVLRPWQPGRASKDRGPGTCEAVRGDRRWVLVATGSQGEERLELPPGEPLLRLTFGERGLEVDG